MERLLTGADTQQPGRHGNMSYGYGTKNGRRKSIGGKDAISDDPTMVPQSSMFGFLERLPWKIGGRKTRYRPNAANLQENVGKRGQEAEPLIADDDEPESGKHRRSRSGTVGSRETGTSLSSRGDIFPSDDEDDAHEIDDEFAVMLGRRSTGATTDDNSSKKKPTGSRASTKTGSSKNTKSPRNRRRAASASSESVAVLASPAEADFPSLTDLKREEVEAQIAEESNIQQRRQAAQRLASERGFGNASPGSERGSKEVSIIEANELPSPDANSPIGNNNASDSPSSPGDANNETRNDSISDDAPQP